MNTILLMKICHFLSWFIMQLHASFWSLIARYQYTGLFWMHGYCGFNLLCFTDEGDLSMIISQSRFSFSSSPFTISIFIVISGMFAVFITGISRLISSKLKLCVAKLQNQVWDFVWSLLRNIFPYRQFEVSAQLFLHPAASYITTELAMPVDK